MTSSRQSECTNYDLRCRIMVSFGRCRSMNIERGFNWFDWLLWLGFGVLVLNFIVLWWFYWAMGILLCYGDFIELWGYFWAMGIILSYEDFECHRHDISDSIDHHIDCFECHRHDISDSIDHPHRLLWVPSGRHEWSWFTSSPKPAFPVWKRHLVALYPNCPPALH